MGFVAFSTISLRQLVGATYNPPYQIALGDREKLKFPCKGIEMDYFTHEKHWQVEYQQHNASFMRNSMSTATAGKQGWRTRILRFNDFQRNLAVQMLL